MFEENMSQIEESQINFIWYDEVSPEEQHKPHLIQVIQENTKHFHDISVNIYRFTDYDKFQKFTKLQKEKDYNFVIASFMKVPEILSGKILDCLKLYHKIIVFSELIQIESSEPCIYKIITTVEGLMQQMKEIYFHCKAQKKNQGKQLNKAKKSIQKICLDDNKQLENEVQKIAVWMDKNMKNNMILQKKIESIKKVMAFENPEQAQCYIAANFNIIDTLIFANNVWDQGYQIFSNSPPYIQNYMIYCGNEHYAKSNLTKYSISEDKIFVTSSQTKLLQKLDKVV